MTSFLVWMVLRLPIDGTWLGIQMQNSFLAKPLLLIAYIWIPLVPKIYRELKTVYDY